MQSHPVNAWHALSTEAVAEALASDGKEGLSSAEAARRLAAQGLTVSPRGRRARHG